MPEPEDKNQPVSLGDGSAAPQTPGGGRKRGPGLGPGGCGGVAAAVGVFVGLLTVVAIVAAVYLAMNWRSASAGFVAGQLITAMQDSALPEPQTQRIVSKIESVRDRFIAGELSVEQVNQLGEIVFSDPLIEAGLLYHAKQRYLQNTGLTEAERAAADRAVQRLMRGVFEGSIPAPRAREAMAPVTSVDGQGIVSVKEGVTAEEVRAFAASAGAAADEAGVPDEPYTVDVAERFEMEVDRALEQTAGPG